jgi:DNA polymerase V
MPFFPVFIPAGFPSPAADYPQEEIDLNKYLKCNSSSTFIIRVQGDSMIGAHITNNSLLVVDKALKPRHNSIVVAVVNGEYT